MKKGPFFVALIYFILGMLWILYSDWLTYHILKNEEIRTLTVFQNIKGGFYILLTTILLYFLIDMSQKKLFRNKKNLDALINNTSDMIWSIDTNRRLLSANKAYMDKFEKITGIRLKIGDNLPAKGFDGYNVNKLEEYYNRALRGESFTIISKEKHGDQHRYYEISFNPIFEDDSKMLGIGCFARDITDRMQYEQERDRLVDRLIAQNDGLEEFGYVTSHKIRAPVATILGIVNLLNKDNVGNDRKRLLDYLHQAANMLDETIKDLAEVMELQAVDKDVLEEINLNELCAQAQVVLEPLIDRTGALLHCDFSLADRITSNNNALLKILVQLLSNSMLYVKKGETPEVHINSFKSEGYVGISISDNGLGIDLKQNKDHLFKLYKRFHWNAKGKGIGLYIVKALVDGLDGKLEIDSEPNKGTTIKVLLKQNQHSPVPNQSFS